MRRETRFVILAAALGAWAVAMAPTARRALLRGLGSGDVLWLAAALLFLAATLAVSADWARPHRIGVLLVQTAAGLACAPFSWRPGLLLIIVAAELAVFEEPPRRALVWIFSQTVAQVAILFAATSSWVGAVGVGSIALGIELALFGAGIAVRHERNLRQGLASVNAELVDTRELFADATRLAERLRIARDLHDSLGHHLTAVHLELELAHRVADEPARAPIDRARALAKGALAEVRLVVSAMRDDPPLSLPEAIERLSASTAHPRIHLSLIDLPALHQPRLARTLFRAVQELLTNAIRHACANNVWIEVARSGDDTVFTVRDDGRGAAAMCPGFGLSGVRERMADVGGRLEIETRPGAGLRARLFVPVSPPGPAVADGGVAGTDTAPAGAHVR